MEIQERVQLLSAMNVVVPAAPAVIKGRAVAAQPITGTGECGLIVGAAMHGCVDGLTVANKYAVVNSQLLAERAASAKFDNETQPKEWFKLYLDVLRICGWTLQGSEFDKQTNTVTNETVEQATMAILRSVGGAHVAAYTRVIGKTFTALRANAQVSSRFHAASTSGTIAKFRVLPCMQTVEGDVRMVLTSILSATHSTHEQTNVPGRFWDRVIEQTGFDYSAAECVLNTKIYNQLSGQIEKKLVGDSSRLIDALDLL